MNKNRFEHVGSHVSCSHAVTFLHVRMYVPSVFTCIHRQGSKLTGVLNSSCADSGHHFLNITHKTIVLSSNFNVQSHRNYFLNVAYWVICFLCVNMGYTSICILTEYIYFALQQASSILVPLAFASQINVSHFWGDICSIQGFNRIVGNQVIGSYIPQITSH